MVSSQYKLDLSNRTGTLGPQGSALWPNLGTTSNGIVSMASAPLIYRNGVYQTAIDATAFDLLPTSFINSFGSKAMKFGLKDLSKKINLERETELKIQIQRLKKELKRIQRKNRRSVRKKTRKSNKRGRSRK